MLPILMLEIPVARAKVARIITRIEQGNPTGDIEALETSMTTANDLAVRRALEAAGVEFIDQDGGVPGVRLRYPLPVKSRK